MNIHYTEIPTPIGILSLGATSDGYLCMCDHISNKIRHAKIKEKLLHIFRGNFIEEKIPTLMQAEQMLNEYFSGWRHNLEIPLKITGTEFQKQTLKILAEIPYGRVISYSELAEKIAGYGHTRAVANAVATNPLSIFIPCHRVIQANGKIGGYAGGTLAKRYLLQRENYLTE